MISKIYINNLNFIYFYLENNNIYISSINSNRKKRRKSCIYTYNNNMVLKKDNIFKKNIYKKKYITTRINILNRKEIHFFKGVYYGFKSKIKIVGRGWKIIKTTYNTLLIKLGFSHPLFLVLNPLIKYKVKKKKKKYYVFYGTHFDKVHTLASVFNLMRIPDTYTRKGIFNRRYIL